MLSNISQLDAEKQTEILNNKFSEWKGDLEQVDDVLVFGLKIS